MPTTTDPARDLLFGLIALQNGLIDQDQLVTAFRAWTFDKARPIAEYLTALDDDDRAVVLAMVARHLKKHGGDVEKSLAAVNVDRSTCESLTRIRDAGIDASLAHLATVTTKAGEDDDRTVDYGVGAATSDGQRFRVLRPHARGGLGVVYVALDAELNREVALKQILGEHADDAVSRQRFLIEAEITGGLEHPGIVPIYGLGTYANGRPYYAMRFIRGDSLKETIGRFHADEALKNDLGGRSLEVRKLLRRFVDVCNTIDYAHSRGVIHRDIKPGNVIVGKHGETLLVDWGLAKAMGKSDPAVGERTLMPSSASGSAETLPGSALGTPAYMSPEQAEGNLARLGPRSDVYSLGATLYCLLTGEPPFSGEVGAVLGAVRNGEFQPPRKRDASIDGPLEAVCLKAMALGPEDRYATPKALAEDIERWMADEPVTAWREPLSRRARRWARRNRTAVVAVSAAVLVALAGTGAVLAVQTRANHELTMSNDALTAANSLVTKTNASLHAANERERQRFDLAMEAIKLFHGEVSQDLLLKEKQFEGLRTRLLRGAARFYGKLETLLMIQDDVRSRKALGRAYDELADLTGMIGSQPEALALQRKALAAHRNLASLPSADAGASLDVARSLLAEGQLEKAMGDMAAAMAAIEEAGTILRRLADAEPSNIQFQGELARSYNNIGKVLSQTGKPAQALAAYEQARAIQQKLAGMDPPATELQSDLAGTLENLGWLHSSTGKPAVAMATYEQAAAIQRKLADANPSVTQFQSTLASSYGDMGWLWLDAGNRDKANELQAKALAIRQKLADDNPAVTHFQSALADSYFHIAKQFTSRGKPAEALAAAEKARAILQKLADNNPAVTWFQSELAIALLNIGSLHQSAGRVTDAADAYRKTVALLEKPFARSSEVLYNLGCGHARLAGLAAIPGSGLSAAEGQAEADRAMSWLREAITNGFRNISLMRNDSDLDPLRTRPDFQLLLMDLAMPADAFAW